MLSSFLVVGLSPDAYIQMALQLAWYRTRGEFTATYETVLTRLFHHARTETIRTFSRESRAWVLAMMDSTVSSATKRELFGEAIQAHLRYTRTAATGKGVDRHLLGLRCMMTEEELKNLPELFRDEFFGQSQTWKLSTSGLSAGHQFRGTGWVIKKLCCLLYYLLMWFLIGLVLLRRMGMELIVSCCDVKHGWIADYSIRPCWSRYHQVWY